MVAIDYKVFAPESIELINSPEFQAILDVYPSLRLVTSEEDEETWDEVFIDIALPLPEGHDEFVGVINPDNDDEFMWILYDDYTFQSVGNPSPAFIEILKVMDAYSIKTINQRAFLPINPEHYDRTDEMLASKFDYATGDYIFA